MWSFTDRKEFSPGGTVNERTGILPYISRRVLTHTYYNDTGHLGNHLELDVLSLREAASKKNIGNAELNIMNPLLRLCYMLVICLDPDALPLQRTCVTAFLFLKHLTVR